MTLFYKLSILMGFIVVASNYLVQFPIQYLGLSEILTYGAFSYPITFLITALAISRILQHGPESGAEVEGEDSETDSTPEDELDVDVDVEA